MNIYVGNVPYAATEEDLETLFGEYGASCYRYDYP